MRPPIRLSLFVSKKRSVSDECFQAASEAFARDLTPVAERCEVTSLTQVSYRRQIDH